MVYVNGKPTDRPCFADVDIYIVDGKVVHTIFYF